MDYHASTDTRKVPWNKGKLIGKNLPLKRIRMQKHLSNPDSLAAGSPLARCCSLAFGDRK